MSKSAEKALSLLRHMPRLTLRAAERMPDIRKKKERDRGKQGGGFRHGAGHGGMKHKMRWPALGWESGNSPIQQTTPCEPSYNYGWHAQRQYPPLSLQTLQLMIDTGRIDTSRPIDLAAICNSKAYKIDRNGRQFGVNLTSEGMDRFAAKVNIEVQWASEQTIAAVERNGGVITTAYFDIFCVNALSDPKRYFSLGHPVPRRLTPPADALSFYTDPATRGYLADPERVAEERLVLAQKYGYDLPDIEEDFLRASKDPRQVFYGLEPGWIVNLKDKSICKPLDKELQDYYKS